MYSFLKIFFERNNKIDSTVSSFGNVFRNSKWSNLQIQNIKKLFIKQWLGFFLFIVLSSLFIFTFSETTLNIIYLSFFYFKQTVNELLTNCYYFVGCVLYQLHSYLNSLLLSNQVKVLKTNKVNLDTPSVKANVSLNSTQTLQTQNYSTLNTLNTFFLQKTLPLVNNLSFSPTVHQELTSSSNHLNLSSDFTVKIHHSTISNSVKSWNKLSSPLTNEVSYILSPKLNSDFNNSITLSTTLDSLYANEGNFSSDPMLTETLTQGYNNIAKQQRWLTRNFWSNQNFVNDSNLITQAKTFIQNPLLSNSAIDTNIWLSNKLVGTETESASLVFNQLTPNSDLLSVFNSFDSSRFFLNQRYSFLNRLDNQTIINSISKPSLSTPVSTSNTVTLKLTLLQSYFTRNVVSNTLLYTPSVNSKFLDRNLTLTSNAFSNEVRNLFVATTFTDLLQQGDLQSLNTINASVNNSSKLYLNRNFNSLNSFKS